MIVMKFGGSSVSSADNIKRIISIVLDKKEDCIVVLSAFGGVTDVLEKLADQSVKGAFQNIIIELEQRHTETARELIDLENQSSVLVAIKKEIIELEKLCDGISMVGELSDRSKAKILSFGEVMSSQIIAEAFKASSGSMNYKDARELIVTDSDYLSAKVLYDLTNPKIKAAFAEGSWIVPGFIARTANGAVTTLGRGGSDYTASIIAAALDVTKLEIWSDVNGMLRADPRKVKTATSIKSLSYTEALELSHFGAKVLFPPAIQPVMEKEITLLLKNTFDPDGEGTLIYNQQRDDKRDDIVGITSLGDVSLMRVSGIGMIGVSGSSARVFKALKESNVNVMLISQSCSEYNICIGVNSAQEKLAANAINDEFEYERSRNLINDVIVDAGLSVVAIVGEGMRHLSGTSGKAFSVLGENGINIVATAQGSSERNITIVINEKDETKAINLLHESFFTDVKETFHLFICGIGNVGSCFLKILEDGAELLKDNKGVVLKVIGISNSRKMLLDENGIDLNNYEQLLEDSADKADINELIGQITELNLRNSVFIDNTANKQISETYLQLLANSISVVACNKIAASSKHQNYQELKQAARKYNTQFRFETCVGSALPVIGTINDLVDSGDKVRKIEAVLSGSLNFIFNNYNGSVSFSDIVKQAKDEGYTEPDPLIDLSGVDVKRKILILAREAGYQREMEDVFSNSMLPDSCLNANSSDELFEQLTLNEPHFKKMYEKAAENGAKLKFVASFTEEDSSIGLQEIPPNHSFYNLDGQDNIVAIHSDRYPKQPLVIKGAGAGAELTAAGVFSDIMRIVNS